MAKQGMRRPDPKEPHGTEGDHRMSIPKNEVPPVPEIQGKAKTKKKKPKNTKAPARARAGASHAGLCSAPAFFHVGSAPIPPELYKLIEQRGPRIPRFCRHKYSGRLVIGMRQGF